MHVLINLLLMQKIVHRKWFNYNIWLVYALFLFAWYENLKSLKI